MSVSLSVCLSVHMLNLTHCLWTKAVRWKYMEIVSLGVDTNRYRYTLRSHYTASEEDTLWSCVAPLQLELPAPESRCHRFVQQLLVLFINRKYDIFICVHTHTYVYTSYTSIHKNAHAHTYYIFSLTPNMWPPALLPPPPTQIFYSKCSGLFLNTQKDVVFKNGSLYIVRILKIKTIWFIIQMLLKQAFQNRFRRSATRNGRFLQEQFSLHC